MMWILSVIQSQIGATNPDPKMSFKESFSRKHVRRKYKRKLILNPEGNDQACNSLNEDEEEDDESSEIEKKSSDLKVKTRFDKNALKFSRFVFENSV